MLEESPREYDLSFLLNLPQEILQFAEDSLPMLRVSVQRRRKCSIKAAFLLLVLPFGVSEPVLAQTPGATGHPATLLRSPLTDAGIEKRVEALLQQMTLEEKVGPTGAVFVWCTNRARAPATRTIQHDCAG